MKSDTVRNHKKRWLGLGSCALLCFVGSWQAKDRLDNKVQSDLAQAVSKRIGQPVQFGHAVVGLTGTLEVSDLKVGDFFVAKKAVARISSRGIGVSGLGANDIWIDSPQVSLQIYRDGSTSLNFLRNPPSGRNAKPTASGRGMKNIHISNGSLNVDIDGIGHLRSAQIDMQKREDKLHVVAGMTSLDMRHKKWTMTGQMPHLALDYNLAGRFIERFLSTSGAMKISDLQSKAQFENLVLSQSSLQSGWQLNAQVGNRQSTRGSLRINLKETPETWRFELLAKAAPLAILGPLLPASVQTKKTIFSGTMGLDLDKDHASLDRFSLMSRMQFNVKNFFIAEKKLSKSPIKLDFQMEADLALASGFGTTKAQLKVHRLASSTIELSGHGNGEWQGNPLLPVLGNFVLKMNKVACDSALSALPVALRPVLAGLELRGQVESHMELHVSAKVPSDTQLVVQAGAENCKVVNDAPDANIKSLLSGYQHTTPAGEKIILSKGEPGFYGYRSLPAYVPKAFVAAEDSQFFSHEGFDLHQINRSLAINIEQGRFARGGSTISQQLIKNLFLNRDRTLARKLQELILTWRLEKTVDKKRILELYLNIIEFGDKQTYGIGAGSMRWFGVKPRKLSIPQAAFLAAIIPEPTTMSARIRKAKGLDPVSAERVAVILRAMKRGRVISDTEYRKAKRHALAFAPAAF